MLLIMFIVVVLLLIIQCKQFSGGAPKDRQDLKESVNYAFEQFDQVKTAKDRLERELGEKQQTVNDLNRELDAARQEARETKAASAEAVLKAQEAEAEALIEAQEAKAAKAASARALQEAQEQ